MFTYKGQEISEPIDLSGRRVLAPTGLEFSPSGKPLNARVLSIAATGEYLIFEGYLCGFGVRGPSTSFEIGADRVNSDNVCKRLGIRYSK